MRLNGIERVIERISSIDFSPVGDTTFVVDKESICDIVEKLNEVIDYINNKEREHKGE